MLTTFSNGSELRAMRQMYGLTQAGLAKAANLSQSMIARMEKGNVEPRLSTIIRINEALHSSPVPVKSSSVERIMSRPVIYTTPRERVSEVIKLMERYGISQLPVMERGRNVGSITDTELVKKLTCMPAKELSRACVGDVMSPSFKMIDINEEPAKVFRLMRKERALLVMRSDNIAGIITKADVLETVISRKR